MSRKGIEPHGWGLQNSPAGSSPARPRPIGRWIAVGVVAVFVLFELLLWLVGALTH